MTKNYIVIWQKLFDKIRQNYSWYDEIFVIWQNRKNPQKNPQKTAKFENRPQPAARFENRPQPAAFAVNRKTRAATLAVSIERGMSR